MNSLDFWRKPQLDSFERALEDFFGERSSSSRKGAMGAACEISETAEGYQMKFDLPGLKKEDIKVDLHDNLLTVSGERREEIKDKEDKKNRTRYSEISYGSFSRSYSFPTPVDANNVDAKYSDGVLSIRVQKSADSQSRQITIQ